MLNLNDYMIRYQDDILNVNRLVGVSTLRDLLGSRFVHFLNKADRAVYRSSERSVTVSPAHHVRITLMYH